MVLSGSTTVEILNQSETSVVINWPLKSTTVEILNQSETSSALESKSYLQQ